MIETRLADRLETITPHVYPNVAPTDYKTPCVVYQVLDTEPFNDVDGYTDEAFVTVQLSISSTKFSEAKTLAREIRENLRDWDDGQVQTVSWINETVAVDNSTSTTLHRVMLFFKFYTAE